MTKTVEQVLAAANDSVSLINDINTNGGDSEYIVSDLSQEEINDIVQRNVDHLELVLTWDGSDDCPDVAGSSDDKSSYTDAITTGKAYIAAN